MPSAIEEASAAASLETPAATATAPQPTPAPAAPAPAEAPKPAATPTPTPEPAKPATAPETPSSRATAKIEKILGNKPPAKPAEAPKEESLEELEKKINPNTAQWRAHDAYKKKAEATYQAKITDLETRIKAAESKPSTPANDGKLAILEKQLEELSGESKTYKQRLTERDYRESDDYKEKFVKPWNRAYGEAYQFVEGLQALDEDGNPARQATKADFDKVKIAPLQQRRAVAKALFGEDSAGDVVEYAKELDRIGKASDEAIAGHAQNFEKIQLERSQAAESESKQFAQIRDGERADLESKFPAHFSVEHYKDQPELQKALADGYEEYDSMLSAYKGKSPEDRAADEVTARAYYAAFPLLAKQNEALTAQVESLTKELLAFRGSDPGNPKPGAVTVPAKEEVGGISVMAEKFNQV